MFVITLPAEFFRNVVVAPHPAVHSNPGSTLASNVVSAISIGGAVVFRPRNTSAASPKKRGFDPARGTTIFATGCFAPPTKCDGGWVWLASSWTQCAAVRIRSAATTVPPHQWSRPLPAARFRDTIHGQPPGATFVPLMIRGLGPPLTIADVCGPT